MLLPGKVRNSCRGIKVADLNKDKISANYEKEIYGMEIS